MPRKYVMAKREDGRSDIIIDCEVVNEGTCELWVNHQTPADLSDYRDPTIGRPFMHEPPEGGAAFRVVVFPKEINEVTPEQMLEFHASLNSVHVPTLDELRMAKHPTMHRTDTLNYFVLLSGRLWMLSEERDVLLQPGDYVVQQACMHGWRVEGDEPAVLACVLIDAR